MFELQERQRNTAGGYLGELMDLVVRASPGPFTVVRTARGRWQIVRVGAAAVFASVGRNADAELLAVAVPAIRALSCAVAGVLAQHRDAGEGTCGGCGRPMPCPTRNGVEHELAPRSGRGPA